MKKTFAVTASGLLLLSAAAMAQTTGATHNPSNTVPSATSSTGAPAMNATPLRQDLADSLKKSGFTDVKVVPDSFFVQAKDKSGNPISMLISPNSVTEMTNVPIGVAGGASANGQTGSTFVASAAGDTLSSKLVGTDVHNSANQDIGTIKDVAMRNGQVQAYVLSVGGFLGMGDHYVAVAPQALNINYDSGSKTPHATLDATQAQLKAAPAFQYPTA